MLELLRALEKAFASGQFEPFIRDLRFPHYKNFVKNARIEFNFPITVITGQNGTNKSSIIKTLYACSRGKSLGDLWFSSAMDVIVDPEKGSTRFIYSYFNAQHGVEAEILQNRRRREGNADYWETSKPSKKDGMKHSVKQVRALTGKARWEKIEKDCLLVDFRSELSAFDRFFYHVPLSSSKYLDKRDFLRARATQLRKVLDTETDLHRRFGSKGGEWSVEREVLPDELVADVNYILGKSYSSLTLLRHNLYGFSGYTVLIRLESGPSYTEAFAGSGEFAAIMLVKRLHEVKEKDLLLMDEPEMSLHPSAQKNLLNLICAFALTKKLQVVISTHSPFILEGLPKQAIRTLYDTPHGIDILQDCEAGEAFFYISPDQVAKKNLFCEDRLAAYLVEHVAKKLRGLAFANQFTFVYLPGGVTDIKGTFIVAASESNDQRAFYILDGDQKPSAGHVDPAAIPSSDDGKLSGIIKAQTKGKDQSSGQEIKFPMSSDHATLVESQRRYLEFYRGHVYYLPRDIPEDVIVENSEDERITSLKGSSDTKTVMEQFAFELYSKVDGEKLTSNEIFEAQKIAIGDLPSENDDFQKIIEILETILAQGA